MGRSQKRRKAAKINPAMADSSRKKKNYRSVGIRSDPVASLRFRILCLFGAFGRCMSIVVMEAGGGLEPKMKDGCQD